jgi:hypothetical protein
MCRDAHPPKSPAGEKAGQGLLPRNSPIWLRSERDKGTLAHQVVKPKKITLEKKPGVRVAGLHSRAV